MISSFCRATAESSHFSKNFKQPLPENITHEELLQFNIRREFDVLKRHCPLLFHVVSGAMGLDQMQCEVQFVWFQLVSIHLLQDPSRFLAGGTCSAVSLHEPIVQVMGQIQYIAHPRSRSLLPIINGCYGIVKHLSQDSFKLANNLGTSVSRKSALKVIDRLTEGPNKVNLCLFGAALTTGCFDIRLPLVGRESRS